MMTWRPCLFSAHDPFSLQGLVFVVEELRAQAVKTTALSGVFWKLRGEANGDPHDPNDWQLRQFWVSRSGTLYYHSVRQQRMLYYFDKISVAHLRVEELRCPDQSEKPQALRLSMSVGTDYHPLTLAATDKAGKDALLQVMQTARAEEERKNQENRAYELREVGQGSSLPLGRTASNRRRATRMAEGCSFAQLSPEDRTAVRGLDGHAQWRLNLAAQVLQYAASRDVCFPPIREGNGQLRTTRDACGGKLGGSGPLQVWPQEEGANASTPELGVTAGSSRPTTTPKILGGTSFTDSFDESRSGGGGRRDTTLKFVPSHSRENWALISEPARF